MKRPETQPLDQTPTDSEAERTRMAYTISMVTFWVMIVAAIASALSYLNAQGALEGVIICAVDAMAALLSAWMSKHGRAQQGILVLLAVIFLVTTPFIPAVVPGQGLNLAVIGIIMTTGIAMSTLPRRWTLVVVILAFLQGLFYIIYDFYGQHAFLERVIGVSLGLFVMMGLVYGYFNRKVIQAAGLRTRMVMAFLVVSLIPLIVLSLMNSQRLTSLTNAKAEQELGSSAKNVAEVVDTFLHSQMEVVRTESRMPVLAQFVKVPASNISEALPTLRNLALKDPVFITSYAILDRTGRNILDTNPENVGKLEGDRPYFENSRISGLPYASSVMFYEGMPRLYVTNPIRDADGETIGMLRAEYNAAVLEWLVKKATAANSGGSYVTLVDDQTFLRIAHSTNPNLMYSSYSSLNPDQVETLQKIGRLPSGTAENLSTNQPDVVEALQSIDQTPFFYGSSAALSAQTYSTANHLTHAPWYALARVAVSEVSSEVSSQTRSTAILAIISTLLVTLAALGITQVLAAPIVRLTGVAEQVAAGNLDARAPVTTRDEIGVLAETFNTMTGQLQDTLTGLEQRVAERTRALELSSDVSRRLSTILDPAKLVSEVVELLQFAFNYYHVHIYQMDESEQNLVMVGGTGEAGKIMLERGHAIPRGRGLVGRACESGSVVLVRDATSDPNWLPNPLLPETRSEIAVPIMLGDEVLGALDVQQNVVNGLTDQDADLLRSIASQLAIALRNARQYQRSQLLAQQEALTSSIIEQIQKTKSVEDALQVAVRELGRALNTPRTGAHIHVGPNGNGDTDIPKFG
jgi:putative methionine-R-sulfoxide reductase with GAF domain